MEVQRVKISWRTFTILSLLCLEVAVNLVIQTPFLARVRTNFLPVQRVYTEQCKFCHRLQYLCTSPYKFLLTLPPKHLHNPFCFENSPARFRGSRAETKGGSEQVFVCLKFVRSRRSTRYCFGGFSHVMPESSRYIKVMGGLSNTFCFGSV